MTINSEQREVLKNLGLNLLYLVKGELYEDSEDDEIGEEEFYDMIETIRAYLIIRHGIPDAISRAVGLYSNEMFFSSVARHMFNRAITDEASLNQLLALAEKMGIAGASRQPTVDQFWTHGKTAGKVPVLVLGSPATPPPEGLLTSDPPPGQQTARPPGSPSGIRILSASPGCRTPLAQFAQVVPPPPPPPEDIELPRWADVPGPDLLVPPSLEVQAVGDVLDDGHIEDGPIEAYRPMPPQELGEVIGDSEEPPNPTTAGQ